MKTTLRLVAAALALTSPLALSCSQAQNADRFAKVEIKTEKLTDNIAVLFGAGGNIAVSHGPDGTVLIDDQFAPLTPKIQTAVKDLGAEPVRFLINTHWHGDHTGGNENFGKAGAVIMAHDNVRVRMAKEAKRGERVIPPSPKEALPVVTYKDGIKLHLNGDTVYVKHISRAHTDGDSIVFWKKANVLHMGDLYFNKVTLPFIDLNSGGNARGVLKAAEKALKMADEETQIIPGHGPMATKADLTEYRDMLKSVLGAVEKAMGEGKSLDETKAMKLAAKWDTNPNAFIKGDAFVEAVYRSLQRPERPEEQAHNRKHKR